MRGHTSAALGILYAVIALVLIAAKLAGHLHWAWWAVLLPIWGPLALVVIIVIFAIAVFGGAMDRGENPFQ